jgi:hypothetical protein
VQWGLGSRLSRPLPAKHPEFGSALVVGKEEADQRMIRSMYQRGVGYDYDAVKIFMPPEQKVRSMRRMLNTCRLIQQQECFG